MVNAIPLKPCPCEWKSCNISVVAGRDEVNLKKGKLTYLNSS